MKKLYMLCNAHIDPVWQWQWQEGAGAVISTFSAAADFCEEFDGFVFNHNESLLYEWVEEYAPCLFERIKKLVTAGKWHIMGGWFLQPDCNMSSGESIVRQIIKGQRYFKSKFGVSPTVAVNFDSFGHSKGLVQILEKADYRGYVCCRPMEDIPSRDVVWEGFNNSKILLSRAVDGYNTPMGKACEQVEKYIKAFADKDSALLLWGVGNHGGGPSRKDLQDIKALQAKYPDIQIIHSNLEEYFDMLENKVSALPHYTKSLNYVMQGCYTSQIDIKQQHMALENELFLTEKMLANTDLDYPALELEDAERDLLFCEFHDILPGTSIASAKKSALSTMSHGMEILSKLKNRAFMRLCGHEPRAKNGEYPILVYNPHAYEVEFDAECEFMLADQNFSLDNFNIPKVYKNGVQLPCQLEKEESNIPIDWRKKVVFRAKLAPMQVSRFSCFMELCENYKKQTTAPREDIVFKNGKNQVIIGINSGLIESYKVDGTEILTQMSGLVEVIDGYCDTWGFSYDNYRKIVGKFSLIKSEELSELLGETDIKNSINIIEDGEVRTIIEAYFKYKNSYMVVKYILSKFDSSITIKYKVYNNEKDKIFVLKFNSSFCNARYLGKVCYGVEELETTNKTVVAQDWTMLKSENSALGIINFGNYGSRSDGKSVEIMLMQSPAFTAHPIETRKILRDDRFNARIDQGEHDFEFVIMGGEANNLRNIIDTESIFKHQAPIALNYFPTGEGKCSSEVIKKENRLISLTALKKAGDGLIVRLFNSTDRPEKEVIEYRGNRFEYTLNSLEILTLKCENSGIKACKITENNL